MSKTKPRVTIVGLGLIGGSIGMALRQAEVASVVIGHDKEPSVSKMAKKLAAVDKTDWNLVSACEESDLIILSIPVSGIKETFEAIGPYLHPGCVIVDTASLKTPVLAWADEILPDQVHFVGTNPIIAEPGAAQSGLDAARADLFHKRLFCLVPSAKADPNAVKLASDLVSLLGAGPLFVDAMEHDGLMGAVEHLPSVMALALLETVVSQPSWKELRKVAGAAFENSIRLSSNDPTAYSDLFLSNRDNILRWIDAFAASLTSLRQAMLEGESEVLADRFEALLEERNRWLLDRSEGRWDDVRGPEMPRPNLFVDTFLGGLWRKRPKEK